MRKIGSFLCAFVAGVGCLFVLTNCKQEKSTDKIVTVTIVPQQYFAEQIAGDRFDIHTMVPPGSSPESFDPPASSLVALSNSQAYFQIGSIGFERAWMDKLKSQAPEMKVFDNSKGVEAIFTATSCCAHHDHNHDHSHGEGYADPHIWTTPKHAMQIARNMTDAFIQLDPQDSLYYRQNLAVLQKELKGVHDSLTLLLEPIKGSSFVIYHPSLTYFAQEYGLNQLSIESDGKEPSVSQLKSLVDEIKRSNARVIFIQEEFDQKHAQALGESLGLEVVQINPLSKNWKEEMLKIAHALNEK